jgi:hypothetical protein
MMYYIDDHWNLFQVRITILSREIKSTAEKTEIIAAARDRTPVTENVIILTDWLIYSQFVYS